MKVLEAIKLGSKLLKEKNIHTYILDSELLLSKSLNKSREKILINLEQNINKRALTDFNKYLVRRSRREPIAYLLEEKEFWSKKFFVNKNTLIPRPETELMVEKLVTFFKKKRITILDIGTGTGCIIVSLLSELKNSTGIAVDISSKAIMVAKKNAYKFKLSDRIKLLNKPFEDLHDKKFDLIVSNPPYVKRMEIKNLSDDIKKFEPRMALDGGNDGLDLIKKVIYKSKKILKINGTLALEIGNEQINKVSKILIEKKFRIKCVIKDYRNNVRCVFAELR
jgi:release factor glutamine methyltransferase